MTTFDATSPFRSPRLGALLEHPKVAFGLVVAATAIAYNHSLLTLGAYLESDTPIAYVALVPLLVLAVVVVRSAPRGAEPRLPHRHADWMIGLPLLGGAALFALVLPERLHYSIWTNRLDLLGLPLFAAGLISITFGARVLRRVALPLALLVLAWPLPYERLLTQILSKSQELVLAALNPIAPLAPGVTSVGDATFRLGTGPSAFEVNVAPACAGANSGLGFLLVGGFALFVIDGSRKRKIGWLAFGILLTQLLNLSRLIALFLVGARFGRDIALDWLHPYLGLVLFMAATVFMFVVALRLFGLKIAEPKPSAPAAKMAADQSERPVPPARPARRALSVTALVVACSVTAVLGTANAGLARFDPFSGISAAEGATSQIDRVAAVPGMTARRYGTVDWIGQYFGKSARWTRYYASIAGSPGQTYLDVQQVADVRTFERFGLEACYRFHGREIIEQQRTDIGYVVPAQTMLYADAKDRSPRTWALVSWVWPVTKDGERRFERVVLLRPVAGTDEAARVRATEVRSALLGAARSMVATSA